MSEFPRVPGLRTQYHFHKSDGRIAAWHVHRLIHLSAELPVEDIVLPAAELDEVYWFDDKSRKPTVRRVVEHAALIADADLTHPIILGADGRVMDGMHRIARALMDGCETVRAVRFPVDPDPDYVDCGPEDLPYD